MMQLRRSPRLNKRTLKTNVKRVSKRRKLNKNNKRDLNTEYLIQKDANTAHLKLSSSDSEKEGNEYKDNNDYIDNHNEKDDTDIDTDFEIKVSVPKNIAITHDSDECQQMADDNSEYVPESDDVLLSSDSQNSYDDNSIGLLHNSDKKHNKSNKKKEYYQPNEDDTLSMNDEQECNSNESNSSFNILDLISDSGNCDIDMQQSSESMDDVTSKPKKTYKKKLPPKKKPSQKKQACKKRNQAKNPKHNKKKKKEEHSLIYDDVRYRALKSVIYKNTDKKALAIMITKMYNYENDTKCGKMIVNKIRHLMATGKWIRYDTSKKSANSGRGAGKKAHFYCQELLSWIFAVRVLIKYHSKIGYKHYSLAIGLTGSFLSALMNTGPLLHKLTFGTSLPPRTPASVSRKLADVQKEKDKYGPVGNICSITLQALDKPDMDSHPIIALAKKARNELEKEKEKYRDHNNNNHSMDDATVNRIFDCIDNAQKNEDKKIGLMFNLFQKNNHTDNNNNNNNDSLLFPEHKNEDDINPKVHKKQKNRVLDPESAELRLVLQEYMDCDGYSEKDVDIILNAMYDEYLKQLAIDLLDLYQKSTNNPAKLIKLISREITFAQS